MSSGVRWETLPNGKRYVLRRQNERTLFRLEDDPEKRWLSRSEFERLTGHRDPDAIPRNNQVPTDSSDQRVFSLFPRETDQQRTQEAVSEHPPGENYRLVTGPGPTRGISENRHTRGTDAAYINKNGHTVYPSGRRPSEPSVQPTQRPTVPLNLPLSENQSVGAQLTPLSRAFVDLGMGGYEGLWQFVSDNPGIVSQTEISSLTNHALEEEKAGRATRAQTCIHHAILLRRCRDLERRGPFFRRMSDNESDTFRDVFADIKTAYAKIQTAARGSSNKPESNAKGLPGEMANLSLEATKGKDPTPRNQRQGSSDGGPLQGPQRHEAKAKVKKGLDIKSTAGDSEGLDPRYRKQPKAETFFTRGRVFAVLWHENAGGGKSNTDRSRAFGVTRGPMGEEIYSHIIRMVVVKEGRGSCWCLPINTYSGQGVTKKGFIKSDREAHAIIHMSDTQPYRSPNELDITKQPIKVDAASPEQKLDHMSRLNFSKVHTVNHYVKAMNVGIVHKDSMPYLTGYFQNA